MQLRRWEQVLLHLSDYDGIPFREGTLPVALTQQGVGLSLGISRSQASSLLNDLESKGMVSSENHHVKDARCMVRCYFIENLGREEVDRIHGEMDRNDAWGRFRRAKVNGSYLKASKDFMRVSNMLERLSRSEDRDGMISDIMELVNSAMNEIMEGSE